MNNRKIEMADFYQTITEDGNLKKLIKSGVSTSTVRRLCLTQLGTRTQGCQCSITTLSKRPEVRTLALPTMK